MIGAKVQSGGLWCKQGERNLRLISNLEECNCGWRYDLETAFLTWGFRCPRISKNPHTDVIIESTFFWQTKHVWNYAAARTTFVAQSQELKNAVSIFLVLLILLQSFSKVWIVLSFKVNQGYIAKTLCVNRNKPERLCNGKCVLAQRLKADEGQGDQQLPQKIKEQPDAFFCFEIPEWLNDWPTEILTLEKPCSFFQTPFTLGCINGVFRPPNL